MSAFSDAVLAANEDRWLWVDDVLTLDGGPVFDPDTLSVEDVAADERRLALTGAAEGQIHADLVAAGLAMPDADPCPPGHWAITDSQDEWPENWEAS
jgi:hypothetical protein